MLAQNRLDGSSVGARGGADGRDRATAPHHHKRLTTPLDRVEQLGKAAGRLGGTQALHKIRLSDLAEVTLSRVAAETPA